MLVTIFSFLLSKQICYCFRIFGHRNFLILLFSIVSFIRVSCSFLLFWYMRFLLSLFRCAFFVFFVRFLRVSINFILAWSTSVFFRLVIVALNYIFVFSNCFRLTLCPDLQIVLVNYLSYIFFLLLLSSLLLISSLSLAIWWSFSIAKELRTVTSMNVSRWSVGIYFVLGLFMWAYWSSFLAFLVYP